MTKKKRIICWWSGGVTSAIACLIAIELFGLENCEFYFIDTKNEDPDTYRFKKDCELMYGKEIETLSALNNGKFMSITEIWRHFKALNNANGAICSSELKRAVRLKFEKENIFDFQIIGFDIDETHRAKSMTLNYPYAKIVYPLLFHGLSKKHCIERLTELGVEVPITYKLGFKNNNCFNTGCVQGGIGYWQKMKRDQPEKFYKMADIEHELTDLKGSPVTMLKDQAKKSKGLVFLVHNPKYPHIKDISMMKGHEVKPLVDCNGYCSTNDLKKSKTEKEINYQK